MKITKTVEKFSDPRFHLFREGVSAGSKLWWIDYRRLLDSRLARTNFFLIRILLIRTKVVAVKGRERVFEMPSA